MAAMIGKWVCCPELTTGFEEFMTAIGSPEEERKKIEGVPFIYEMSRNGDNWKASMRYPELSHACEFKSGVEFELPCGTPGCYTKNLIHVGESDTKSKIQSVVDGKVKREWETTSRIEGHYLVYKSMYNGKEMIQKLKRM